MHVYRVDVNSIWTGESRDVGPKGGWRRDEVRTAPPALSDGQVAQWRGHVWVVMDGYPVEPLKRDAIARLASRRWQAETGGMTFKDASVATDDRSKALIYGARGRPVQFKLSTGEFVPLDASETEALAESIGDHVQACFDREAELLALIEASEDAEAIAEIDLESGWP